MKNMILKLVCKQLLNDNEKDGRNEMRFEDLGRYDKNNHLVQCTTHVVRRTVRRNDGSNTVSMNVVRELICRITTHS